MVTLLRYGWERLCRGEVVEGFRGKACIGRKSASYCDSGKGVTNNSVMERKSEEAARAEYLSLAENLRHYENLFFVNLAAYSTVSGGLVALVLEHAEFLSKVKLLPCVVTVVFGLNGLIYLRRYYTLLELARELEIKPLGYQQYQRMPHSSVKTACFLWGLFFVFAGCFWAYVNL
jgi:hypothetical protein